MRSSYHHSRALRTAAALISTMLLAGPVPAAPEEEVQIECGQIRGSVAGGVLVFKGIPYAAPPVGALRWRAPQPVRPWTGVLEAKEFGPACPQGDKGLAQSEDCLRLNVWRPAKTDGPLPVMVWIHGNALVSGSSRRYPAEALAAQGVIVVSFEYRLGRFGFFAFPGLRQDSPNEPRVNYGYLDQLAVLQWVQRNIAAFRGDPQKVTLFGSGAGGGSVLAHLVSPLSRGLFRGAILQSPSFPTARGRALPPTAIRDAERMSLTFAHSVGIRGEGPEALAALRALPAEKLVEEESAVLEAMATGKPHNGLIGAVIDGTFLTEPPEAVLASGGQARVPLMIGANNRDLALGTAAGKPELFAQLGAQAAAARKVYDARDLEPLDELKIQLFMDRNILEPSRYLADASARAGIPTWSYRFGYVPEHVRRGPGGKGSLPAREQPFVFGQADQIPGFLEGGQPSQTDRAMARSVSAYWVAFAKAGDPGGGTDRPRWPRHEAGVDRLLQFNNEGIVIAPDPRKAQLDLWERFYSGR